MIRYNRLPGDIHEKIALLKDFFGHNPNIVFAYLFGGLTINQKPLSDVDIAIYVKDTKKLNYLDLFTDITNILKTDEVDLVILNKAPLRLVGRILLSRKIIVDKDPFFRPKYESLMAREYFDFQIKEKNILNRRYGID